LFENENLKTAVLRSTVGTDKREDWIIDQVDRDIDIMVCNPELVVRYQEYLLMLTD
jgi:hypothetical protein